MYQRYHAPYILFMLYGTDAQIPN